MKLFLVKKKKKMNARDNAIYITSLTVKFQPFETYVNSHSLIKGLMRGIANSHYNVNEVMKYQK